MRENGFTNNNIHNVRILNSIGCRYAGISLLHMKLGNASYASDDKINLGTERRLYNEIKNSEIIQMFMLASKPM